MKELREISETRSALDFWRCRYLDRNLDHVGEAYPSFAMLLRRFGSTQIRNAGTIGGNIGTASPIGDGPPALIALGAKITLASARGEHSMPLEDFFLDYRKTALHEDEIIKSVTVPKPVPASISASGKSPSAMIRISRLSAGVQSDDEDGTIASARVAFGGMAAIPRRVPTAENALMEEMPIGRGIRKRCDAIRDAFKPLSDWRGTSAYRTEVAGNLALRLGAELKGETVEVMA